jgi:ACS family tartrate transporter-like MFS transporter
MEATSVESVALGKVSRRLIPFLFVLYIFNFLDRTNVGVAALTMKPDLGLSDAAYGLGAGIFFLGYFFFEVPSNLILQRVGARLWMARIMVTWGLISSGMMFVKSPTSFCVLRFLLGVAEAGFFPGMIFYLTNWFPAAERARAISRFMTAIPLAGVLGSPLSGQLLKLNGLAGLKGWQWLFLAEGLPSVVLAIVTLFYLTDRPADAHWLSPEERERLMERLQREQALQDQHHGFTLWQAFAHPVILLFCLLYFTNAFCGYSLTFWTPLVLKSRAAWSDLAIAGAAAVPNLCAAIVMSLVGMHADRRGERRWHIACAAWTSALGFALSAWTHSPILTVAAFALAYCGSTSMLGPFWALSTSMMSAAACAGAIAFINSVGNLGGFAGPYLQGWLKDKTGGFTVGLCVPAALFLLGGLLPLLVRPHPVVERETVAVGEG